MKKQERYNTARRQLIDYAALYDVLKEGKIKGYGVDVYDAAPPQLLPMFTLPNVVLTPHLGGSCQESNIRMGHIAVDNVIAVKAGRTPPNINQQDEEVS